MAAQAQVMHHARGIDIETIVPEDAFIYSGTDLKGRITEANDIFAEIAVSSSQQTEAMNNIGANISHVAAMTEQNVEVVHRTTTLMEFLENMVGRVHNAVAQYRS
jgi:methyl-accepting chemotaxis protein